MKLPWRRKLCWERLEARDLLAVFSIGSILPEYGEPDGPAVFEIYASGDEGEIASIGYRTLDESAKAPDDYTTVSGRVTLSLALGEAHGDNWLNICDSLAERVA